MSLQELIESQKSFQNNLVIDIEGTWFGQIRPVGMDSETLPDDNLLVSKIEVDPVVISPNKTTSIFSAEVVMIDDENRFLQFFQSAFNYLIDAEITAYLGRKESDFSEYLQLFRYRIRDINHDSLETFIKCSSNLEKALTTIFTGGGNLSFPIGKDETITQIIFRPKKDILENGFVEVQGEYFSYNGLIDGTEGRKILTGVIRQEFNSKNEDHGAGAEIKEVVAIEGSPIDIILQLLISGSAESSPYNLLHDGCSISSDLIEVEKMEEIYQEYFQTTTIRIYISTEKDLLRFLEEEIMIPFGLRFIEGEGSKISMTIIDRAALFGDTKQIKECDIDEKNPPKTNITRDGLVNEIEVKWDYCLGNSQYKQSKVFLNSTSIEKIGVRRAEPVLLKGVRPDLPGNPDYKIAEKLAKRYLFHHSRPQAKITVSTFFSHFFVTGGNKLRIDIPGVFGKRDAFGVGSTLQVLKKDVDLEAGRINFLLGFIGPSHTKVVGFAPTHLIETATDQKSFSLPNGAGKYYRTGYQVKLWNEGGNEYYPDATNEIETVTQDQIIMKHFFTTPLTNNCRIRFASYSESNQFQKDRALYVAKNDGMFLDGTQGIKFIIA